MFSASASNRKQCPRCRNRKFRKTASGSYVCLRCGFQLDNYREEQADDDDAFVMGSQIRRKGAKKDLNKEEEIESQRRFDDIDEA